MLKALFQDKKEYCWKVPGRQAMEVCRCIPCGWLLGPKMIARGQCAGHRIVQPAIPTWLELIQIGLGIIS